MNKIGVKKSKNPKMAFRLFLQLTAVLFNIFINGTFYFIKDSKIANYADDNKYFRTRNYANFRLVSKE